MMPWRHSVRRWSSTVALVLCLASLVGASSNLRASDLNKTIDLWMNEAPLTHVIHQLAELSGGDANITGPVEGQVSGRFSGTVADTLETLSEDYNVLFDRQGDTLNATSKRALSEVSIVMTGAELNNTLKNSMQNGLMPGNAIDIQDELVKLSGHPDFVKRIARQLAAELAITPAVELEISVQAELEGEDTSPKTPSTASVLAKPAVIEKTEPVLEQPIMPAKELLVLEGAELLPEKPFVVDAEAPTIDLEAAVETVKADVVDAGTDALRIDIAEEDAVESGEVSNNDSIRWVTDIPGFSTF